jgi:hypothetical protein
VKIDRTIQFSPAKAVELQQKTPPVAAQPAPGMPLWAWLALAAAAVMLTALSFSVYRLAKRPASPLA